MSGPRSPSSAAAAGLVAALVLTACTDDPPARPDDPGSPGASSTTSPSASPSSTPAGCTLPPRLSGRDWERLPTPDKVVALTFDGGAGAQAVDSILETLGGLDVPATFFLTGKFVETFPDESRRIAAQHVMGNHTDTHPALTTLTPAQVETEVRRAERTIRTRTGEDPRRYFRFPFGARTDATIALLNALCYVPFRWTVDTLGWRGTSGGQSAESVVARVLEAAAPGAIVLMHVGANPDDGSTLDADALPAMVDGLRDRGYTLVSLGHVLPAAP